MISTRENLLVRPWQQRKYDYHKKKVLSATPVVDTKSPPHRGHVAVKLKKLQKETERSQKIERDNLILLQKLNYIMTTHWLDNYLPPQPTFLSRVGVYRPVDSGIDIEDTPTSQDIEETKPTCRKLRCLACSPQRLLDKVKVPEERVPWEPQQPSISKSKRRSSSVPPKGRSKPLPTIIEKPKSASASEEGIRKANLPKQSSLKDAWTNQQPNSISISRGSLKLSVNFPPDANVKLDKKRLGRQVCRCLRTGLA